MITTSLLGGTNAEVRCIPSCQLPLNSATYREPNELDLADFGAAEDLVGISGGSVDAGGDERRNAVELSAEEESSFNVQPQIEEAFTNGAQRDDLKAHPKLSQLSGSALREPDLPLNNTNDSSDSDDIFYGIYAQTEDVPTMENRDETTWRRLRRARSAETWSGFRAEGVDDAPALDQEEFVLPSSIFALSGDTAHNQAMVHWSGENSSVSSQYYFVCARFTRGHLLTQCGQHSLTRRVWHESFEAFLTADD